MSGNRARRIAKEIADIKSDQLSQIIVEPCGDDLTHLKGQFRGPPDTPYEGGTFFVDIKIPGDYPFRPPNMRFDTKLWHPNVSSQTGAICLDTLSSQWSPVLTIKSALISLQSLLSTPEPKDPQDAEVAGMMIRNPSEFEYVARDWAVKYANAPKKEIAESSGGATAESIKRKAQVAKENEEKSKLAAYVSQYRQLRIIHPSKFHRSNTKANGTFKALLATFHHRDATKCTTSANFFCNRYHGYNKDLIDRFVAMGFDVEQVVAAFEYVGIDKMGGEDYELEEAYMGDITARLFGEA